MSARRRLVRFWLSASLLLFVGCRTVGQEPAPSGAADAAKAATQASAGQNLAAASGAPRVDLLRITADRPAEFTAPTEDATANWLLVPDGTKPNSQIFFNSTTHLVQTGPSAAFGFNYVFNFKGSGDVATILSKYSQAQQLVIPGPNNTLITAALGSSEQKWVLTPVANREWTYTLRAQGTGLPWVLPAGATTLSTNPALTPTPITLAGRVPPDLNAELALWPGEAQLFTDCAAGAPRASLAIVVNSANAYTYATATGTSGAFVRILIANDTVVHAYSGTSYAGTQTLLTASIDCNAAASRAGINSVKVQRAHDYVLQTRSCAGCNMAGANLRGLDFKNVVLTDVSFAGSDLTGASFAGARLTRVDFSGTTTRLGKTNFIGAELTDVNFDHADIADADFSAAFMTAVRLTNTDLTGANLNQTRYQLAENQAPPAYSCDKGATPASQCARAPTAPLVCATTLRGTSFRYGQIPVDHWSRLDVRGAKIDWSDRLAERRDFCGLNMDDVDFDHAALGSNRFNNASLNRATFRYAELAFTSFVDTVLKGASFAYADLKAANFEGAVGDGTNVGVNFTGTIFSVANIKDAGFTGADFSDASITMPVSADLRLVKSLKGAKFTRADFNASDLTGMQLNGGIFDNANLSRTILTGAQFGGADGRSSTFLGTIFCGARVRMMDVSDANLSGALLPLTGTFLTNADTGLPITCAAVDLFGAATIEDAVTGIPARCPDTSQPRSSGCEGKQWQTLSKVEVPVCPSPAKNAFAPARIRSCFACKTNCECATERCIAGQCAGDCPK